MTDHLSITHQILLLTVYDLHLKITEQHLQAAQEAMHWNCSPQEIKVDAVRKQGTVLALQLIRDEALKTAVQETPESEQGAVQEQTLVEAVDTRAMKKKSRGKRKTCGCFSWLWSCRS